jgi:DNA-binding response OmpR family regulator
MVLIIDDDGLLRELTSRILARAGYETLEAGSGRTGIEFAKSQEPDLILLDLKLPDLDGFQVLSELRHFPATAAIPIIMMTASSDVRDEERAFQIGATAYFSKPFQPRQLLERIHVELNHAAAR